MAATTISVDSEAYRLLKSVRGRKETFSDVIKRCIVRPAETFAELDDALKAFEGVALLKPEDRKRLRAERGRRSGGRRAA